MEVARDYTGCYPKHEAHLGVEVDWVEDLTLWVTYHQLTWITYHQA